MPEHTFRTGRCIRCGITYYDLWSCGERKMDRLTEKLTKAAGVNARVAASIEKEADDLIAREQQILDRKALAFEPHHAALNARMKELDRFEDGIKIVENASPLKGGGDSTTLEPGSGAPTEPGTTSGAD